MKSAEPRAASQRWGGYAWCPGSKRLHEADAEDNIAVLVELLTAENEHAAGWLTRIKANTKVLAASMRDRDGADDESLAVRIDDYLYFERWSKGDEHLVYCRRPWNQEDCDQLPNASHPDCVDLLDVNALARNRAFFDLGDIAASPCQNYLAWTVDTTGDERYCLFVKDLRSDDVVDVSPPVVDAEFEWCHEAEPGIMYGRIDDSERVSAVRYHRVGGNYAFDPVIYQEADDAWSCGVYKSRCRSMMFIQSDSFDGNEVRVVSTEKPLAQLTLIARREDGFEYYPERLGDALLLLACDENEPEFQLYRADCPDADRSTWTHVLGPETGEHLDSVEAWTDFYCVSVRRGGSVRLDFYSSEGEFLRSVVPQHPLGGVDCHENPVADAGDCRLVRTSPVHPERIVQFSPGSGEEELLWEENPGDDYKPEHYAAERFYATSHDGALVPLSLLWRRDRCKAGGNPVMLHAYGAYDDVVELGLDTDRLGLLDAGMIWAVAHVRGGGEGGRSWYESGRLERKFNSVADYLACLDFLEKSGRMIRGQCVAEGRSAGGIVVAAAMQARPDAFAALIAEVPFVDMVNSLLDEALPTTLADRDEFGDPRDPEQLASLFRLSPVDTVPRAAVPPVLVTTGLHDARVPVREALRWVNRLRERNTASTPILMLADINAGHQGPSGRTEEIHRIATLQSFALTSLAPSLNVPQ